MYRNKKTERVKNPRENANIFSLLSFIFTWTIFRTSAKRELVEDDIYAVLKTHRSAMLGDRIEKEWDKEQERKKKPYLLRPLTRAFGKEYLIYGLINVVMSNVLMMIKPIAIGRVISYFSPNSTTTKQEAYMYGGILVTALALHNIYKHAYFLAMYQLGLKIRIALSSLLYRKSLKLTQESLINISNGKLVTMITKDVTIFEGALQFFHDLWCGFIKLFVMAYIMYLQINVATFVGILFLLLLIPFQALIARATAKFRFKAASKTDERLRRIQEILTWIKLIKFYCWEQYFVKLTNAIRKQEMKKIRGIYYLKAVILTISQLSQRVSFYLCIFLYIYLGNVLTAEKVFVVMQCYGNLRYILTVAVPMCIAQFAEVKCSLQRIRSALISESVDRIVAYHKSITKSIKIGMKNLNVLQKDVTVLKSIEFSATQSLIGLTGGVGSGKSTFLKAILRDTQYSGLLSVNGTISYASQDPWLFPATLKQNILFGLPYDAERYQNVVKLCCLTTDFATFPLRDETIITDKGLNLSKGQQARVNLARAIYKQSDIYLLDDILSSLDASVSRDIFNNCLKTFLKDKLVLFVSHNKNLLKETDRVVILKDGAILADGLFNELEDKVEIEAVQSIDSQMETIETPVQDDVEVKEVTEKTQLLEEKDTVAKTIYGESPQQGKISWAVYKKYLQFMGGVKALILILFLTIAAQSSISYFDFYITKWLKTEEAYSKFKRNITLNLEFNQTEYEHVTFKHFEAMYIYSILIVVSVCVFLIKLFTFFGLATYASKRLHNTVFSKVIRATMVFFDTNRSGNVLNRFSRDFAIIDEYMPYCYYECLRVFFGVAGIIVLVSIVNPFLLAPGCVVLLILLWARYKFLRTSRTLKRLEGITKAPIIGYLNTSLEGLTTIRASGNQAILQKEFDEHQDLNSSVTYMYISTSRAFAVWIDMLCWSYVCCIVFSFLYFEKEIEGLAGKVGLAITQAMGLTGMMQWGVRQWAEIENLMTSVERVLEYNTATQENYSGKEPTNWPQNGAIEYRNVCLTYNRSSKYILNDVSFKIAPNERVGVVGRTGAGKSSIIAALFRLYEIDGSVLIDNDDVKSIELGVVRSNISIIPQDPVLFAGTIRTNLDPNEEFSDFQIWNALKQVELKYVIENSFKQGLHSEVNEGGVNFSVGQRQLLCLARAMLRNNKILILDEATANIDTQTDAILQNTIKTTFSNCTILTIAHRLNTIIDSDKIMVVDAGRVIELDNPKSLLARKQGIFYSMAKQAGLV